MKITLHAVERFAERALKIDNDMPVEDKARVQRILQRVIIEECPEAIKLKSGTYSLNGYGCKIVVRKNQVVTVKTDNGEKPSFLLGGICKSGRKVKKFLKSQRRMHLKKDEIYE